MSARRAACRRKVLACARCRRQKIKCDRADPCGNCRATQSACTGYTSAAGGISIPKSIVASLESQVAQLESTGNESAFSASQSSTSPCLPRRVRQGRGESDVSISRPQSGLDSDQKRRKNLSDVKESGRIAASEQITISSEMQSLIAAFAPEGSSVADAISNVKIGLTPSLLSQEPTSRIYAEKVSVSYLSRLPPEIIQGLVQKYIHQILPTYPCLHGPKLCEYLASVLSQLKSLPEDFSTNGIQVNADMFFVYMVLAVATSSQVSGNCRDKRRETLARSLFEEGIKHWSRNSTFSNDVTRIQAILMILQYAFIDPGGASVWMLSGAAMRFCIAFGLHCESSWVSEHDPLELELRRRVFWTTYCADRTVCTVMQRPVSLPDDLITTRLPKDVGSLPTEASDHIAGERLDLTQFRHWISYCRLQADVLQHHLQDQKLPSVTMGQQWMSSMQERVEEWYMKSPTETEASEIDRARALVNLHRPSPRSPRPSDESLKTAYEAAITVAKIYKARFQSKTIMSAWQTAHDLLGMSMVVLFCLRHGFSYIRQNVESVMMLEDTKIFTIDLVSLSEQGWPELLQYARTYERLLSRLLDPILTASQETLPTFTPSEDAELAHLLHLGSSEVEKHRDEPFVANFEDDIGLFDLDFSEWVESDALFPVFAQTGYEGSFAADQG